ncbi:MAG: MoaD/ThiS family protein [Ktedonobacterales bacterium]|nr:MoaD/ThiS family protein [Ktedonobacterales bacterium]
MAHVQVPRALTALVTGMPTHVQVEAQTVQALIAALDRQWPGVATCLCSSQAHLRPHINVFVDGERATLMTPIRDASVVRVLMAVSGG